MASEYWWNNDGYGDQAIKAVISLWKTDDGATSAKIHAAGGAQTYNSDGWGGSWINFAGHEESGGCYGYSYNYYWANSSWWWSDYNVGTVTKTYSEQTITRKCYFVYGRWPGITLEASASITVGAKAKYTVSYNADGGTGAPSNQDKWHDETLALSSAEPTKSGFRFKGWTGSDGNTYQPGNNYTGNATLTLTAIWQAEVTDLENVADIEAGENPSFSWIPQASDLTYKIKLSIGEWSWTSSEISPGTNSKYTYNSYTVPLEVCNQIPTQTSGLMTAELETYSEGIKTGTSTVQFTVYVPDDVAPEITSVSLYKNPTNALNVYLQNMTKVDASVYITKAYGSEIEEATMTIGDNTITVNPLVPPTPNYTIADLTSDVLDTAGEITITFTATDYRGRTATATETITVYEYEAPSAEISLTRTGKKTTHLLIEPRYTEVGSNSGTLQINSLPSNPFVNGDTTLVDNDTDYLDSRNLTYWIKVSDAVTFTLYEIKLYPGKGNRFRTLSEDQFYVGMDDKGWKDLSDYDGDIDDEKIWFERTSGTDPVGVGMPMILEPDTDYELLYAVNDTDNTVAVVSFFWINDVTPYETGYTYISTTENLRPGDIFHTPELEEGILPKVLWGIVTLGATLPEGTPIVRREFTDVKVRKVEEDLEKLEWTVETGNMGLDTPLQKYISKVVIRMAFEGQMHVDVAYDNDPFKEVYRKASEKLKSFDIPINVKRCDHFRFRIGGKGIAKIYSIGYNEEAGSEIQ